MNDKPIKCALCHNLRFLRKSHFFPAAIYKIARAKERTKPDPFLLTESKFQQTSFQANKSLLCSECEQIFHKQGENYVLRMCFKREGQFPLQSLLNRSTPLEQGSQDTHHYAASHIPEIDFEQITYFGISILWRAAVTNWSFAGTDIQKISLGLFEEQFRRYLVGELPFPEHVVIQVVVSTKSFPTAMILFPHGYRYDRHHTYRFIIPGIEYWIHVGKSIPMPFYHLCFYRSKNHVIFLSDHVDNSVRKQMTDQIIKDNVLFRKFMSD